MPLAEAPLGLLHVVDVVAPIEVIFLIGTVSLILVTTIPISHTTTQITIIEEVLEDVVISEVVLEELVGSVLLVLVLQLRIWGPHELYTCRASKASQALHTASADPLP